MSDHDEEKHFVLHSVRLVGYAGVADIVRRTGLSAVRVKNLVDGSVAAGELRPGRGPAQGWMITDDGRRKVGEWIVAEIGSTGAAATLDALYRDFGPVNASFLEACRRWQVIDAPAGRVANPHDDIAYDRRAAQDIVKLVESLDGMLDPLVCRIDRFGHYRRRFAVARDEVRSGHHDFLTRPLLDSCHTIWFEFHEDLLVTTGRTRSSETGQPPNGSGAASGGGNVDQP